MKDMMRDDLMSCPKTWTLQDVFEIPGMTEALYLAVIVSVRMYAKGASQSDQAYFSATGESEAFWRVHLRDSCIFHCKQTQRMNTFKHNA